MSLTKFYFPLPDQLNNGILSALQFSIIIPNVTFNSCSIHVQEASKLKQKNLGFQELQVCKKTLAFQGASNLQQRKVQYSILGMPQIQNRKNSGILVRSGHYPRAPANASTRRILLQANGCSDITSGGILDHYQTHKHSWKNATSNAYGFNTCYSHHSHSISFSQQITKL